MDTEHARIKQMSLAAALIPIVSLVVIMGFSVLVFGADPHIPLFFCAIIGAVVGIFHGYKWKEIEKAATGSIAATMQPILILILMGPLVGIWIMSGTVPSMVFYGLKLLSPTFFLAATCLLCCIVSLSTGSSWTTVATVGIALIGISTGLGIPNPLAAGAIISGAYFGDKMSPLSDTTNLAPAVAGVNIFDHIRHMVYTTTPSLIISLLLFLIIGFRYSADTMDTTLVEAMSNQLAESYHISPLLLIPPVLVILMVVFRIEAIPGMVGGIFLGMIFYVTFQHEAAGSLINAFGNIIDCLNYGAVSETGNEIIDDLLTGGGIQGMMWTISLILCALAFGGIVDNIGCLRTISRHLLKLVRSSGSLVLVTIVSCIMTNVITGDVYLSIMIPGKMYKDKFDEKGLDPKNLSRCLEDSGTLTSCLIPWNSCGAFISSTLGVGCFAYLPYCFFNLLNPIVSVIYGYTGFSIVKKKETGQQQDEGGVAQ